MSFAIGQVGAGQVKLGQDNLNQDWSSAVKTVQVNMEQVKSG